MQNNNYSTLQRRSLAILWILHIAKKAKMQEKATLHSAKVSSLPGTVCTYEHAYIVDGKLPQDDVTVMAAGGLFPVDSELDPFTHHVIV
jgi:hypothetical protein